MRISGFGFLGFGFMEFMKFMGLAGLVVERLWVLEFMGFIGFWGLEFRVGGVGVRFRIQSLGSKGFGFGVQCLGVVGLTGFCRA